MTPGAFVWYELATTDTDAASRFYGHVLGWAAEPVQGMPYTLFKAGEAGVAGLMELPVHLRERGIPPHWIGHIGVEDVDASAGKVQEVGGTLQHGPQDIPGVGRFAVLTDPDGAPFCLFRGTGDAPPAPAPMTKGHVGWRELHGGDPESAFGFYAGLFGWTRGQALDMGPMGMYQLFGYAGLDRGGMMRAMEGQRAAWLFYFVVSGLDAAFGRVQQGGGMVMHGPQEVPGGAWILQCRDPQGAAFALVSGTR